MHDLFWPLTVAAALMWPLIAVGLFADHAWTTSKRWARVRRGYWLLTFACGVAGGSLLLLATVRGLLTGRAEWGWIWSLPIFGCLAYWLAAGAWRRARSPLSAEGVGRAGVHHGGFR